MQSSAFASGISVERQDAIFKGRYHILVEPLSENRALRRIAAFPCKDALFNFQNSDCRQEEVS